MQTLGSFKRWKKVDTSADEIVQNFDFTIPPDIMRLGSSTTLRVLRGGATLRKMTFKQMQTKAEKELTHIDRTKIYGQKIEQPILGNYYKQSKRTIHFYETKFDSSFPYVRHNITHSKRQGI